MSGQLGAPVPFPNLTRAGGRLPPAYSIVSVGRITPARKLATLLLFFVRIKNAGMRKCNRHIIH
eukprot:4388994-Pleurochrysis_carterae.AAC.1